MLRKFLHMFVILITVSCECKFVLIFVGSMCVCVYVCVCYFGFETCLPFWTCQSITHLELGGWTDKDRPNWKCSARGEECEWK